MIGGEGEGVELSGDDEPLGGGPSSLSWEGSAESAVQ